MTIRQWRKKEIDLAIQGLDSNRIVILRGVRGSGKSTALGEIARILSRRREETGVVSIDLEDPRLAPRPRKETLELFSRAATDSHKGQQTWILLDEAERVSDWLIWARDFRRKTGAGVIASVSGQPSEMKAKASDIAVIPFFPLCLRDWIDEFTDKSVNNVTAREVLPAFLRAGGLPTSWNSQDQTKSLVRLFNEILFHDVITKSEVRGTDKLTAIAVYLVSMTAESFSLSHMKGILTRSLDQARAFLSHLERSGLVHIISRLEDADRDRHGAARRTFAADCGLATALSGRGVAERALLETAVYTELRRLGARVLAWKAMKLSGLAAADRSGKRVFVQVECDPDTDRDTRPLARAMARHDCTHGLLLANDPESGDISCRAGIIAKRPVWSWLLEPSLLPIPAAEKEPGTDPPERLPAHLL